jgi:hypothetical protein
MNLNFVPFPSFHLSALSKSLRVFGIGYALLLLFIAARLLLSRQRHVAQLGGLTWKRNQFTRGWLITGDTGSGKTSSGINQLAHQVFQNEKKWGGLCIDEKGVYWETLSAMARFYERENDLIHLQIHGDGENEQPLHRFNLTGDRSIPYTTYAKFVVDTATSLGQSGDKGFFKSQAQTHIAYALELLCTLGRPVTLSGALELLSNKLKLDEELEFLTKLDLQTPRRRVLNDHFKHRFLEQPPEQIGGVRETIGNYLQYFLTPEVAEIFCAEIARSIFRRLTKAKSSLSPCRRNFKPSGVM